MHYANHVHSLGYTSHNWAWDYTDARAQLRAAAFAPTEPVPGGESDHAVLMAMRGAEAARVGDPAAKQYNCAIGVSLNITGAGTFTDADGTRGRYSFNAASSTLTFTGGSFNAHRARYGMRYSLHPLHILGPSARAVNDCDRCDADGAKPDSRNRLSCADCDSTVS